MEQLQGLAVLGPIVILPGIMLLGLLTIAYKIVTKKGHIIPNRVSNTLEPVLNILVCIAAVIFVAGFSYWWLKTFRIIDRSVDLPWVGYTFVIALFSLPIVFVIKNFIHSRSSIGL